MADIRTPVRHAYDDVAGLLKTGDLFVAHGNSLISKVIEDLTWSDGSHSGMVVLAEDIGLADLSANVLLWESTRSTDLPDIVTGNHKEDPDHPGGTFYEPKDFSTGNTRGIALINGASLGEQIWVDRLT